MRVTASVLAVMAVSLGGVQAAHAQSIDKPQPAAAATAKTQSAAKASTAQARPAAALARFDVALALQPRAQPYIASDHARLQLQRARALRQLGRSEEALAGEAAAHALLAGSVGLDSPLARRLLDEHAEQ